MGIDDLGTLNAFLHRILDDRERGEVQAVEVYQALFPGSDAAIASEYAALTGAPAASMPDDALQQIGPYRLLGRLGHGSFGLVYRAEDTRLQRTVALKVLAHAGLETQREREQFEREAVIASRLDHPGICTVHEIARHGLWTCIAMRHVPGETLAQRLARAPAEPLPPATALALVEKVAHALHAAHEAGVVHRDVKPGNIMVTPKGDPVVVDFGLARDTRSAGSWSATADRVGSPSYMAPEQVEAGIGPVDARTDVWALGVVLHECLAQRRPFEHATQTGLFDAIVRREPAPLRALAPHVSRDVAVVVATALAKEPARRYQSAQALALDLARAQRGEPVLARPIGQLGRLGRWVRRSPLVAALLAAVLLSLSAGLLVAGTLWVQARANLEDWERLADGRRFVQLQKQADDELLPALPDKVAGIEAWLAAARELLSRRADHERALQALRARARPWSDSTGKLEQQRHGELIRERAAAEQRLEFLRARLAGLAIEVPADLRPLMREHLTSRIDDLIRRRELMSAAIAERVSYEFDDVKDQLQHDEITELVLGLRRLAGEPGPRTNTIASMQQRLENARTLRRRTIDEHAAAWREAIERVRTNPVYAGMQLSPQLGLIPIGRDPQSTLEEFAAPETGAVPERGTDGHFVVKGETALVFVLIPAGRFLMGAQAHDAEAPGYCEGAAVDEQPVRALDVGTFLLSKFEMTQAQWYRCCLDNPSTFNEGQTDGALLVVDSHPVETVSYQDCTYMLHRLGWWLPTEARWEYACRAGTTTPWYCAEAELCACANLADRSFHAVDQMQRPFLDADDGRGLHAPVGSYRPNAFGLHDMIGNVGEWCYEQYVPYDPARTTADAVPHILWQKEYVVRGGDFGSTAAAARSSARERREGTMRSPYTGVRPMRAVTRD
ncbi:MAG TPA: SUMF1/EgtB/PvdO family nonheme iron enzyme [Planctomycetota bacterium]|nr:SUMF1/EgtB/PvdO family nonheme iron enzyme [Planctomycetota bacterium]